MATIVLNKIEDFKSIVNNANQWVFWMLDKESGDLLLYASSESIYCLRLTVNDAEGLNNWLESNFSNTMEIKDLF